VSVQIRIDVSEIEDFARKMQRLPTGMQTEVHEALGITANLIKADAKGWAPVLTGFLRSTIYAKVIKQWVFVVGAWAYYARFQELGTRYIRAVRFLGRAVKRWWPRVRDMIQRAIVIAAGEAGFE